MGVRFLLVDALNLIRRVYAATPEDEGPEHFERALQATVQSLRRALRDVGPTHAVSVFDGTEPTWRHQLYQDYKAGRKPMPELLRDGLERYRAAFDEVGVRSLSKPELEADDVAATLATKVAEHDGHAVILSTDKVYCQLISDRITIRDHFLKKDLDRGYVIQKFGVGPELLVDFWGLAGNASTHIPGVAGVGAKTAAKLLEEHGSLEGVLAGLRCDFELGWNLKMFRFVPQGE